MFAPKWFVAPPTAFTKRNCVKKGQRKIRPRLVIPFKGLFRFAEQRPVKIH